MAAIKFNKDMLLKHRFWIMVSVTSCLTLLGMVYLQLYGNEDVGKVVSKLKAELAKLKQEKAEKGPMSLDAITKVADEAKLNEVKVWSEAYKIQEPLFRWSDRIEKEFGFLDGKFAREIKMSAKTDEKSWPADTETVMHGTLAEINQNPDWIRIKNRKGELIKFNPVDTNALKITADGQAKPLLWYDISEHGTKSLLTITYQTGKYFNDLLTGTERKNFKETYAEQIHAILHSVDPLDDKGNGVVQLRNWRYNKDENFEKWNPAHRFIRIANHPWNLEGKDFSAEAWIAQENFWIQKEIYRIIRSANDDIAVFDWYDDKMVKRPREDLKGKVAQKVDHIYRFKNSALELELKLDKDHNLALTVKNLLARKQKLDMSFRVLMNDGAGFKAEIIPVSGLPLNPKPKKDDGSNSVTKIFPYVKDAKLAPRTGIYSVEQQLTWETAAIKRIDQISIGAESPDEISHSHRTYPLGLRSLTEEKPAITEKDPKKDPIFSGRPDLVKPPIPALGGFTHGLWPDHYVDVTEQSRRLPVAIVLIVDQDHVDRILTGFNNSKFRFLETQVLLNHFPGSLQPPLVEEKKENVVDPLFIRPGPRRPFGEEMNPIARASSSGDSEANMELVIYGVMTLYQRYPPRAAAAAPAKAP